MAASNSNSNAFFQSVSIPTFESLYGTQSPEITKQMSKYFAAESVPGATGSQVSNLTKEIYAKGLSGADFANQVVPGSSAAITPPASAPDPGWTFITAPEDVSWDIANQASRIDMFGTNNPPVVAGSRGMRDLTLSNSLVEGFIRNVTVEAKVAALEKLMEYSLNASDGFVSVPVYQVWANKKPYGGPAGYFIIKDVKVKETMRDLTGNTTRAYVDVSLMQVPEYQVNSGRDQASTVTAGGDLRPQITGPNGQGNNAGGGKGGVAGTPANGGSTSPSAQPAAGPGVGTAIPAVKPQPGRPLTFP